MSGVFDPAVAPFAVALVLMLVIALAELAGALMGIAPSGFLDNMLPEIEVDLDAEVDLAGSGGALDADAVAAPDAPGAGPLSSVLGWLCVGKVPILVLLIAFLTAFGLAGYAVQAALSSLFGVTLPAALAVVPALCAAVPATRASGLVLARLIPKEQTDAVSRTGFIGRIAVVIRGVARQGSPAEAKLTDAHGLTHYLLVEPDDAGEQFTAGDAVLLVREAGGRYRAIANPNPVLTDDPT
ncbi:MAG: YqiJ family protein [Oceanicaulis sp.]